jgi:hypothetical protein
VTDLVTLQHPGGVARVHRDADGQVWLSGMDAFGGTLIDGRFTVAGIVDGLVAGGLLPSGATRAVLEGAPTHVGGGAWLGRIDDRFDTPAVRFEDDAGNVVRPPLPSAWPVEPVPDADAPCPACGATT